jgi:hypothetical protein
VSVRVCTTTQVREDQSTPTLDEFLADLGARTSSREWALAAINVLTLGVWWGTSCQRIRDLVYLLAYADSYSHTGRKRRVVVDIDQLVPRYVEVIVELATAHEHTRRTAADHAAEDLLGPLLTAPVAQIRTFAQRLSTALREDPRVPWMIWSMFERVLEPLIVKGADGEVLKLKTELAAEIAELVEAGLDREELIVAMAGALQWRAPERLEAVKKGLQAGKKPRLTGRESCLFLEIETVDGTVEHVVL